MYSVITKIMTLPGIILGLSLHEFAHAWMSDKLGDPTPQRQGRLTINPIAHIDPIGFIALLIFGFGWGKPVMIDPGYYRKPRRDEFLVAIAGVTMNLIVAIVLSFPTRWLMYNAGSSDLMSIVFYIFYYAVVINLGLMIFNLIPVPPLDGWNIITQIFDIQKYSWWRYVYQYGQWVLIVLICLNVTDIIISPVIQFFLKLLQLA